ncbi:sugar ABC transporter ATP-binding protein [Vibrio panuliri]|uniref:ABC transporter domain-containing protein n=1 Tax=Vibrio panuliri TaxID=1381081 RepID=A0ABX3FQM9_9VIBR|nr:sugar ABC transporter ATP-binding protein [Vibrio panuliri]KAB1458043.1 sugar ABC transporter ATP-binding protein [Vibrio panuliri]OLQ95087.1 hypothetical protein BIY20_06995 [Vibrio panuliri]
MKGLPLVQVRSVCKSFAGVQALNNVSFDIYRGERLTIMGENGSGKSTIIKLIAGVYGFDSGTIQIGEQVLTKISPKAAIDAGIQVIYQDFSLLPNLTVAENLAFNANLASGRWRMDWAETERIAKQALEKIGISLPLDELAGNLSAADRQLIAIAKALLKNTSLIIMDEPTTALTRREVQTLLGIVDDLKQKGISTIFVSHKLEEVLTVSDRVVVLRNGELILEKPIEELDRSSIVEAMSGIHLVEKNSSSKPKHGKPRLCVRHLCLPPSMLDVSFDLYPGHVLGVTGLLGSGRNELAKALMGIEPAVTGMISIDGEKIHIRNVQDALHHRIALVPEDRLTEGLFIDTSIGLNMMLRVMAGFTDKSGKLDWQTVKEQSQRWVSSLSVKTNNTELPVSSLSGGNQQKVVLAKWLASDPKILILVGPTVGVDVRSKLDIIEMIQGLAEQGVSVIVITDDIPELLQVANEIMVMRRGRSSKLVAIEQVDEAWIVNELSKDGEAA